MYLSESTELADQQSHNRLTSPTPFSANSLLHFRSIYFWIFPLAVFGSSLGCPSSPMNQTHAGAFCRRGRSGPRQVTIDFPLTWGFILWVTKVLISSLDIDVPGSRTIHAPTTSPYFLSGTETAAACRIARCAVMAFSICVGNKFYEKTLVIAYHMERVKHTSPPRMMIS